MKELENKLDRIAEERFGEFGFSTCSHEEQLQIIQQILK